MNKFKKEISRHKFTYAVLALLLVVALFVRVYRIPQLLGFWYDQGRDALVIWNFWKHGDPFLVGPTTGIEGILRGPWYYWLITPAYILGGGSPVVPSYLLSIITVFAIYLLFVIAKEISGKSAGLIAATVASFSYYIVLASRWLSNPTPMLLISLAVLWSLIKIANSKDKSPWIWVLLAFLLGQSMQFGSAAEVFYFPAILVFAIWQRNKIPSIKYLLISAGAFISVFVPQILFDILKGGVLRQAIARFLFEEGSFKLSFWEIVKIRLPFYWDLFTTKVWPGERRTALFFMIFALILLVANIKKLWAKKGFRVTILLFVSPLIGMLFFQGNYGNVYGYYFTGYYLIFILLFSICMSYLVKSWGGRLILLVFFILFFQENGTLVKNHITAGVDGPTHVSYGNQKQAIDWIYQDAKGKPFNVDVYVPPVIPYAYDYLFEWYGGQVHGYTPTKEQIPLLYTPYEVDPPHPERLEAWLERQQGIGTIEEEVKFGGIVVQQRERLK